LRVLVYHRIGAPDGLCGDPHILSATPAAFDAQMRFLASYYTPVSADQVIAALGGAVLPRRAVLVTFDDGYRDFLTEAWPVLRRHGVPAVLFVPTAFPGPGRPFWWDELHGMVTATRCDEVRSPSGDTLLLRTPQERWTAVRVLNRALKVLPPAKLSARLGDLYAALGAPDFQRPSTLSWAELRTLAAEGLAIGSHTRTHAALPHVSDAQLAEELRDAHADLTRKLERPAPLFSYPYGMADPRAPELLRALGYAAAFISLLGRNQIGQRDPFALYRHSVDIGDSISRLALSLNDAYVRLREHGRAARALMTRTPRATAPREQRGAL
jgi:peptidoglycan/xylan/chitin deacetylase (PgdA/CDA1 family)